MRQCRVVAVVLSGSVRAVFRDKGTGVIDLGSREPALLEAVRSLNMVLVIGINSLDM